MISFKLYQFAKALSVPVIHLWKSEKNILFILKSALQKMNYSILNLNSQYNTIQVNLHNSNMHNSFTWPIRTILIKVPIISYFNM